MKGRSTNRFTALPVTMGDAFLLETSCGTVLVDGGNHESSLPGLLAQSGLTGVDILACTHNDSDHANGVIGFLESACTCKEVWLPDKWANLLPVVLMPLPDFTERVITEISALEPAKAERIVEFLKRGDSDLELDHMPDGDEVATREDGWPIPALDTLDEALPWGIQSIQSADEHHGFGIEFYRWWYHRLDRTDAVIFATAVEVAARIRRIALVAYQRGITVRWFKFAPTSPSGGLPWLKPVNSSEVARVRFVKATDSVLPPVLLSISNK